MQTCGEAVSQRTGLQIRVPALQIRSPSTAHTGKCAHRPNTYTAHTTFAFAHVHTLGLISVFDLLEGHGEVLTSTFTFSLAGLTKERSLTHPGSSYSIVSQRNNSRYWGPHSTLSLRAYKFAVALQVFPCTYFC